MDNVQLSIMIQKTQKSIVRKIYFISCKAHFRDKVAINCYTDIPQKGKSSEYYQDFEFKESLKTHALTDTPHGCAYGISPKAQVAISNVQQSMVNKAVWLTTHCNAARSSM